MVDHSKGIAEYYERKRKEAERLAEELREAEARRAPYAEIIRLRRRLELARYVGD